MREVGIPLRSYFILKTLFILSTKQNSGIHEEGPELSHIERVKILRPIPRALLVLEPFKWREKTESSRLCNEITSRDNEISS